MLDQYPIEIPADSIATGSYRETRPFHHEQVFHSPSRAFTGTEREFLAAGYGYRYIQIDKFTRHVIEPTDAKP